MKKVKNVFKTIAKVLSGLTTLVLTMIVSLLFAGILSGVQPVIVQGESMSPSVEHGEIVLYRTKANVNRFDVIVARNASDALVIKRVVGLPGDDIAIIDGHLYINNEEYMETYVDKKNTFISNTEVMRFVLKDSEYFILGDNRDNSTDSRDYGPIHRDDIEGVIIQKTGLTEGSND